MRAGMIFLKGVAAWRVSFLYHLLGYGSHKLSSQAVLLVNNWKLLSNCYVRLGTLGTISTLAFRPIPLKFLRAQSPVFDCPESRGPPSEIKRRGNDALFPLGSHRHDDWQMAKRARFNEVRFVIRRPCILAASTPLPENTDESAGLRANRVAALNGLFGLRGEHYSCDFHRARVRSGSSIRVARFVPRTR